jgi:hypothetical protein
VNDFFKKEDAAIVVRQCPALSGFVRVNQLMPVAPGDTARGMTVV